MGIVINCNCETENVQKPLDLSCKSFFLNLSIIFNRSINFCSQYHILQWCNWRALLGFKIRDDGAWDEHVSRSRQGYFCIFNDAYQKLLEAIKQTPGSLKIDTQRHEKVFQKTDCGRSASFPPSSPLEKKFLTIIYYWILEYLENINFFLPLDKMTLNKAVH